MYLIWIFGPKLIRSNNQSSATVWVLETCLIVGLLPFIIILITASLSSNTYNKSFLTRGLDIWVNGINIFHHIDHSSRLLALRVTCVTAKTSCTVLSWSESCFQRLKTIRSHKSSAGRPSNLNPASKEMITDSVELCETEVCFSHIQLIGTNVWLPKMHNIPSDVDVES